MKKPKFLKTSYIKTKIKSFIIKLSLLCLKKNKSKDNSKILIVAFYELGDNIIQSKTIEILSNEFGKNNIYILCKNKWRILYELQNYEKIFVDEINWNIFYKIKLYRNLNKINFSKMIILNHGEEIPEPVKYFNIKEKYNLLGEEKYILEKEKNLLKKLLNKNFTLEEIKPSLNKYFLEKKYKNIICIAIGASSVRRIMRYKTMRKIIEELLIEFKDKKIILLGSGKKQVDYAQELIKGIENSHLKNYVGKLSLIRTMEYINDADLFIGGDSGLMNVAFGLNKKIICLHWSKEKYIWEHPFKNIKIIKGKGGKEYIDKKYGTEILNSIKIEQIKEAIVELNIR